MAKIPSWLKFPFWLGSCLAEMILPTVCIGCGRFLDQREYEFCPECLENARKRMLSRPIHIKYTDLSFAPFTYSGVVRTALLQFKFNGKPHYDKALAKYIAYMLVKLGIEKPDVITYVPTSNMRARKRGYDQAELIARRVSEIANIPLVRALDKIRNTPKQSKLSASERHGNVLGAYDLTDKAFDLYGKRILLIDDVITTGATMSEATKTLREVKPSAIIGAAVAKTGKFHKKRLKLKQQ